MTSMSVQGQQQLCVSQPSVRCLRLRFLTDGCLIQERNRHISGEAQHVPTGSTNLVQCSICKPRSHLSCGEWDVITLICFREDSLSLGGGEMGGSVSLLLVGNPPQCVHMVAHCLTKAATCHRVNVMLALKGPGMYVCYGGGNWGGSLPFKQRRKKWKRKDSLGLCKLNRCFTLGAILTLCLTGSVNSPSLWVNKETAHSVRWGDTMWLHDRLANPQSDTDLERTEHAALRALPSDTPLWISM